MIINKGFKTMSEQEEKFDPFYKVENKKK